MITVDYTIIQKPFYSRWVTNRPLNTQQDPEYHGNSTHLTEALRSGNIMVWSGFSLEYLSDLHIFRWSYVTTVWYRNEVLDPHPL